MVWQKIEDVSFPKPSSTCLYTLAQKSDIAVFDQFIPFVFPNEQETKKDNFFSWSSTLAPQVNEYFFHHQSYEYHNKQYKTHLLINGFLYW